MGGAHPFPGNTGSGARASATAALASTEIPSPPNCSRSVIAGSTGACRANPGGAAGAYAARQAAISTVLRDPGVSDGVAVGRAVISVTNCGTGRAFTRAALTESRTKSCNKLCWRKRTSVFEGWTFTSTSPLGNSRKSSTTGNTLGGITLRYASVRAC